MEKIPKPTRVKKERTESATVSSIKDENSNINSNSIEPNANFYNKYASKKTFSNGLLNGALLATNAAQLRLLLSDGFYNKNDPKWFVTISLVGSSLFGQIVLLILCGVLASKNLADKSKTFYLNVVNNIFLILSGILFCVNIILNVFIQMETSNLMKQAISNDDFAI